MEYRLDSEKQCRAVLDIQNDIQLAMQTELAPFDESLRGQSPKLLYFSDGVLPEDALNEQPVYKDDKTALVDPRSLNWAPWVWYKVSSSSAKILDACDYIGESIAYFLGITSPKYQYEIEEAQRMKDEELEKIRAEEAEMAGWNTGQSYVSLQRGFNDVNPPEPNSNSTVCLVPPLKTPTNNNSAVAV